MTKNFYTDESVSDYTRYGGKIYDGDFGTHLTLKDIADRIISDKKFDNYCKQASTYRLRKDN